MKRKASEKQFNKTIAEKNMHITLFLFIVIRLDSRHIECSSQVYETHTDEELIP